MIRDVASEAVQWLWRPRIALGKVTVLEGDPDEGKSLLMLDLASRLSRGFVMPDGSTSDIPGPAGTLLMTAEDGAADTVRPRLEAANADLSRIYVWDWVTRNGEQLEPELPRDVDGLRDRVRHTGVRLVIVDVLMAYLEERVEVKGDHPMRRALRPLAHLAEEQQIAIVCLRHLTKGGGTNPKYRGAGAVGLGGAARSVVLAGADPANPKRHLLARVKGNLAPPYPTLVYEIFADFQDRPCIRWLGESTTTAGDMLVAADARNAEQTADTSPERTFLEEQLCDGERDASAIIDAGKRKGLSYKNLWYASQKLGVIRRKTDFEGGWRWSLPPSNIPPTSQDSEDLYKERHGINGRISVREEADELPG